MLCETNSAVYWCSPRKLSPIAQDWSVRVLWGFSLAARLPHNDERKEQYCEGDDDVTAKRGNRD